MLIAAAVVAADQITKHVVDSTMALGERITVIPGEIEKYMQFPGTDARNASLLHYRNGEKVMEELPSHHQMIITGRQKASIIQIARVFGWICEVIE